MSVCSLQLQQMEQEMKTEHTDTEISAKSNEAFQAEGSDEETKNSQPESNQNLELEEQTV